MIKDNMADKYRCYAVYFENGTNMIIHVRELTTFPVFCKKYIFDHIELTMEKTNQKIVTANISGIQKIPNQNKPEFELTVDARLVSI